MKIFAFIIIAGVAMQTFGAEFDHSHSLFGQVLKRHVKDGLVDYAALKANPATLNRYLDQLAAVQEREFRQWPRAQQLAFLINLYNAATLDLIIDHYPISSIKKIGGFFKGPWDQEMVRLFGERRTLGDVEHKILRREYKEPRIHFALVCAALGCPKLRTEPYVAEQLDAQLDAQGKAFFAEREKNRVDASRRTVFLSPIFKWFAGDFEDQAGSVLKFVEPYFPPGARADLGRGKYRIRHTDYDWTLNDLGSTGR